jgi:hypothetical protein
MDKSLTIERQGNGNRVHAWDASRPRWFQQWIYKNGKIWNENKNQVIEVNGRRDTCGAKLIINRDQGSNALYQLWDVVYFDEATKEGAKKLVPGKGDLDEDFGMVAERPFYIVSALKEERVLDAFDQFEVGIKTRSSRPSQLWIFDAQNKVIHNSDSITTRGPFFDNRTRKNRVLGSNGGNGRLNLQTVKGACEGGHEW